MRMRVTPLNPKADDSWDQMILLLEIGGRVQEAFDGVSNSTIMEKVAALKDVKSVIRPYCEAVDGDTDEEFKKLSVEEVLQILQAIQAGGVDTVPTTNSATSPLQ